MHSGFDVRRAGGAGTAFGVHFRKLALMLCLAAGLVALSACGGGGGEGDASQAGGLAASGVPGSSNGANSTTDTDPSDENGPGSGDGGVASTPPRNEPLPGRSDTVRFLTRATFGPTDAEVERVMAIGYANWIGEQVAKSPSTARGYVEAMSRSRSPTQGDVMNGIWKLMIADPAQLRIRVGLAWSEIFVISLVDGGIHSEPRAAAAYFDMLTHKGLGNFRDLLQSVALHPMMGRYLSHLGNEKANAAIGRVADENFAREVMQLFTIGLYQLNADGTPKLDGDGKPIETYTADDVAGLAKVFTGWSWRCSFGATDRCFHNNSPVGSGDPDTGFKPMVSYPQFHSTEAKRFLGITIARQNTPDPVGDLRIALDALFNHPNTAPFVSRQLIQRLVTSNPSPAYVRDVAAVFANNGRGVRGDLTAVVKAILTHPEANALLPTSGKIREPMLRLTAFLRAFNASSSSGTYRVGNTIDAGGQLGQSPLYSPSVFNYYRPGYVAPGTLAAAQGLVTPEMQIADEASVPGYVYYMRYNIERGVGAIDPATGQRDLQPDYTAVIALADKPADLVERLDQKFMAGLMSSRLKTEIRNALAKIEIPALKRDRSNIAAVEAAKRTRVHCALLFTLASPEFIVQK